MMVTNDDIIKQAEESNSILNDNETKEIIKRLENIGYIMLKNDNMNVTFMKN